MNKLVPAIISGAVFLAAIAFINTQVADLGNWGMIIMCMFFLALGIFFHYKLLRYFASRVKDDDKGKYLNESIVSLIRIEFEKDCFKTNSKIIGYTFLFWLLLLILIYIFPHVMLLIKQPDPNFDSVKWNWLVASSFFFMPILFHYIWNSAVKIPFSVTGWHISQNKDESLQIAGNDNLIFSAIELYPNINDPDKNLTYYNVSVNKLTDINSIISKYVSQFIEEQDKKYGAYWNKSFWKSKINTGANNGFDLHGNYSVAIGEFIMRLTKSGKEVFRQSVNEYVAERANAGIGTVLKLEITRDDRNDHLAVRSL